MIPEIFDYSVPSTLEDAIGLLTRHGDDAKILSGGHSLIPMMKLRLANPKHLIDINKIPDLDYIREVDGSICIGALVREIEVEESPLIQSKLPIMVDACKLIADPQVRNLATLAGNIAHGDSANDHPAVMLALGAEVIAQGPGGSRSIPITEFFHGFYMTALKPDEIITEIRIPAPTGRSGGAYHKFERKVGDYATAGGGVQLTLDENGVCSYIGIGLTNVGMVPIKATRSEEVLLGSNLSKENIDLAAQYASEDCSPSDDLRGSEDYKRHLVKVLIRRMTAKAMERAV